MKKTGLICSVTSLIVLLSLALSIVPAVARAAPGTEIWDWYDLDAVRTDLGGHYTLMADLDATTGGYTELASVTANYGKGWQPIGTWADGFTGYFDGQGYEITDLFITRPGEHYVGLFGVVGEGGVIEGLGVMSATVAARLGVGILAGSSSGTVNDCYSSGSVTGSGPVGGLVGMNWHTVRNCYSSSSAAGEEQVGGLLGSNEGTVSNSYFTGRVAGYWFVGGLAGTNSGSVGNCYSTGSAVGYGAIGGLVGENGNGVRNSYSTGSVVGKEQIGGLVGTNWQIVCDSYSGGRVVGKEQVGGLVGHNLLEGVVSDSHSTAAVIGDSDVGGLVGENDGGTVGTSYSSGGVSGKGRVGGLVGWNEGGNVTASYARGSVAGDWHVGGLVGENHLGGISDSYSVTIVTGQERLGGLLGWDDAGVVSNCFWDVETSGVGQSAGGTGKTSAEMWRLATFADVATQGLDDPWDIIAVAFGVANTDYAWNIVNGEVYPFLSWEEPPVSLHDLTIYSTSGGYVTVTINEGKVVIAPGGMETVYAIPAGTVVNLVASPYEWRRFVTWTGTPIDGVTSPVASITVQGNYIVTASFEEVPTYQLTISSTGGGWVATPGEGTFTYYSGTVVSLLAIPSSGYRFMHWTGEVDAVGDVGVVSTAITMTRDYSITASFRSIAGCFIATAAYGTPMAQEVQVLREFRDEYLVKSTWGRALVQLYYQVSPAIAELMAEHPALKPAVRLGLTPAVIVSALAVNTTTLQKVVMMCLPALVVVLAGAWLTRQRVGQQRMAE